MFFYDKKLSDLDKSKLGMLLFSLLILLAGLVYSISITWKVMSQQKLSIDRAIFEIVRSTSPDGKELIFQWLSKLGSVPVVATASFLVVIYFLFLSPFSRWLALYFAVGMAGVSIITKLLKMTTSRARPEFLGDFHGTSSSFPSGHTSAAVVFYGFMMYVLGATRLGRKWKITVNAVLVAIIVGISLSRVYLGVHFFSDVITGFFLGCVWLALCITGLEVTMKYKNKKPHRSDEEITRAK
ncbi:phosphatase PAP2 family protein [Halobacillus sp. BBL2006]|uniref:phosphatase PAP2 family protein n=1 Tax=Halobacillus sp. BBL2006 TaxID=1543706 RepID=UPI00068E17B7|nr:phosphatase PAP2 family protein [Halobacillus sp. BBL2006]